MQPNEKLIYPGVKQDIDDYVNSGQPVSDFLYSVLTNNLKESIAKADFMNIDNLPHIVAYLYNKCPMNCWGSEATVSKWYAFHEEKKITPNPTAD
jgi:hypothetical protein